MTQERVMDLIDHARSFHSRLSEYYDGLYRQTDRERVKILVDYLRDAETRHEEALAEYEKSASHDITDTWFQFETDLMAGGYPGPEAFTPDMDVDEVLRAALQYDQYLSDLYKEIIERARSRRIREVFTNLLETNNQEMRNLARDCSHLYDW